MNIQSKTLGGLSCKIVDALESDRSPDWVVVLCHGFGAPGADLVPLGPEWISSNPELAEKVRFVFPEAPLSLDEFGMIGSRAWWHIDMERLAAAIEHGELRDLRGDLPEELPEARRLLMALVEDVKRETGLPASRLVLGGFSQGSILATDVALRLEEPPAALCIFSGTLLCQNEWKALAEKRGNLPVLQSHGRQDMILPFQGALWLRDMLTEAGLNVDFLEFDGEHTIPAEAMEKFSAMLGQLAGSPDAP